MGVMRYTDKTGITSDGSLVVKLTNKTGANSVKGTVVEPSSTTDNAFEAAAVNSVDPFGVVYEDGIADGSECWIVVSGRAQVLLEDGESSTRGDWIGVTSTAGRVESDTTPAAVVRHDREVGHSIESVASGTDVLVWAMIHFR